MSIARRLLQQVGAIAVVSLVLGLCFNASNPIGIRFSGSPLTSETHSARQVELGVPAVAPKNMASAPLPSVTAQAVVPSATRLPLSNSEAAPASVTPSALPEHLENLTQISWAQAKELMASGQFVLVDVRGQQTFDAGHIPGAVSLAEWSTPAEIQAFEGVHGPNTPLIVYCGNAGCPAAEEMAGKLIKEHGYQAVLVMSGGYAEWQKAELGFDPTPTRTTWEETKPMVASGQVILVDARPKGTYEAGHIPGALSLPETSPEGDFKVFEKKYPSDQRIVVYCSDLKCSASMRTAVKLVTWYHFTQVQFMPGGFQEWQQAEAGQAKEKS